jgi:predicted metal-dependent hydrolase
MDYIDINHDDEILRVEVRRRASARRYTLRIHNGFRRAIITMPLRGTKQNAYDLAFKNAAWINERIQKIPDPIAFAPHSIIPFMGQPHRLQHHPDKKGGAWITREHEDFTMPLINICGDLPHFKRRLIEFLKKHALFELRHAVDDYCTILNLARPIVNVRDTKSRWGSCSVDGHLHFSWRLIMAPAFVLNYLAAHEVCHLIHHNHSHEFWALTRRICINTDAAEDWLKSTGSSLYRYGAVAETEYLIKR